MRHQNNCYQFICEQNKYQTVGVRILFPEYFTSIPGSTLKKQKVEIIENALWVLLYNNLSGLCPWFLRERL